jgi:hypothetical protein
LDTTLRDKFPGQLPGRSPRISSTERGGLVSYRNKGGYFVAPKELRDASHVMWTWISGGANPWTGAILKL